MGFGLDRCSVLSGYDLRRIEASEIRSVKVDFHGANRSDHALSLQVIFSASHTACLVYGSTMWLVAQKASTGCRLSKKVIVIEELYPIDVGNRGLAESTDGVEIISSKCALLQSMLQGLAGSAWAEMV